MAIGKLAIIKFGTIRQLGIYRGTYSSFYEKNRFQRVDQLHDEDPPVFTVIKENGKLLTRHYFLKNSKIFIEWLT